MHHTNSWRTESYFLESKKQLKKLSCAQKFLDLGHLNLIYKIAFKPQQSTLPIDKIEFLATSLPDTAYSILCIVSE